MLAKRRSFLEDWMLHESIPVPLAAALEREGKYGLLTTQSLLYHNFLLTVGTKRMVGQSRFTLPCSPEDSSAPPPALPGRVGAVLQHVPTLIAHCLATLHVGQASARKHRN